MVDMTAKEEAVFGVLAGGVDAGREAITNGSENNEYKQSLVNTVHNLRGVLGEPGKPASFSEVRDHINSIEFASTLDETLKDFGVDGNVTVDEVMQDLNAMVDNMADLQSAPKTSPIPIPEPKPL